MFSAILASIDPAAAAEGSNQLVQIAENFGIKPHLLAAQIVNFALVAFILYRGVFGPILKKLDERQKLIEEGLQKAEVSEAILAKAKADADAAILEARKEAQGIIAKARTDAESYLAEKRTQAQKEAASSAEAARRNLALEHEQLIAREQKRLAQLVVDVAEKSLQEELQPQQRESFANRALQSFKK